MLALTMIVSAAGFLYAHATLVRAEPAPDARLAVGPKRVWLLFSEPLESGLARVSLTSANGATTPLTAAGDPHDVHAIAAPLPALAPGGYRVTWRIVSADGHPVDGTYAFSVGDTVRAAPPAPIATDVHEDAMVASGAGEVPVIPAVLRALALGALMALAGLLYFETTGAGASARTTRLANTLAVAAPVLLALHAAAWARHILPDHRLTSDSLATVLSGGIGQVEAWRTGLALLSLWALLLARRPRWSLAFAALALIASGASGHSAAIQPLWAMPARALHLLAGAMWIGGVLHLVASNRADEHFMREARRVSGIATAAVIIVAGSGVLQSLLFLPTPLAVLGSSYGTLVLAKVAGLVVLLAFGAHHRFRMVRNAGAPDAFGGTLRAELAVMTVVTALGAVLAYVSPPL